MAKNITTMPAAAIQALRGLGMDDQGVIPTPWVDPMATIELFDEPDGSVAVVRFGWVEEGVISPASEAAFAADDLDDIVVEVSRQCKLAVHLTSPEREARHTRLVRQVRQYVRTRYLDGHLEWPSARDFPWEGEQPSQEDLEAALWGAGWVKGEDGLFFEADAFPFRIGVRKGTVEKAKLATA
ncbi:MAG: hypothetical protein ACM3KF_04230 [Acidobacteriota bacterium]